MLSLDHPSIRLGLYLHQAWLLEEAFGGTWLLFTIYVMLLSKKLLSLFEVRVSQWDLADTF